MLNRHLPLLLLTVCTAAATPLAWTAPTSTATARPETASGTEALSLSGRPAFAPIAFAAGSRRFELVPSSDTHNAAVNGRAVRGSLAGEPGRFVLAEVDGMTAGAIWTDETVLELRPTGVAGEVRVVEIDPSSLPACATIGTASTHTPAPPPSAVRGASDQTARILVAITRLGENQIGGAAAGRAFALAAVESANAAYDNSLMTFGDAGALACRLELVGTQTVDPGSGLSGVQLRNALRDPEDGVMDEVHVLRDATAADMVALISESGIGVCGVAYIAPTDPTRMFSVTAQSCAIGNLTFAHEIGHTQGAAHDADNAGSSAIQPYGYGWRWRTTTGSQRRSIMAYAPGLRRPFFSTPDTTDGGTPTGDAGAGDNARLIGETFPIIASHRTGTGSTLVDCDENGRMDILDIDNVPALDSNANGRLDSCELDEGLLEDCNNDGIADISQVTPRVEYTPAPVSFSGFPPYEATIDAVPALGVVSIRVTADAELADANEYIDLTANGVVLDRLWENDGVDCNPEITDVTVSIPASEWNALGSPVAIGAERSRFVGPLCPTNNVEFVITYRGLNPELDADGDGVIDSCDPACNAADLAEPYGVLDLQDIGAFTGAFTDQSPSGDLTNDGVFDLDDIAAFVGAFTGGCP